MPETIRGNDPQWADRSSEELEAILNTTQEDGSVTLPDAEPAPVEAEAPAEEAAPEEAEPVAEEPAPEPEEIDWQELAERRAKELDDARKHAARLAGEIGYLKSRSTPAADASDVTGESFAGDYASQVDPDIANELETLRLQRQEDQQRIERLENEYDLKLHQRTLEAEASRIEAAIGGLRPEDQPAIEAAVAKHAEMLADLKEQHDPTLLKAGAKFVVESVAADILAARNQRLATQRTASTAANHRAKIAAAPSSSGQSATPPARQKTHAEMTAAEADAWLRENVR